MIWGIGRNFALHAKELGNDIPSQPIVFMKADACLNPTGVVEIPPFISSGLHFETELALRLDENLSVESLALALDLTNRPEQQRAKQKGEPWALSKSFKGACPISAWIPAPKRDPEALQELLESWYFQVFIDSKLAQKGSPKDWIFKLPQLLKFLKLQLPISPGDIILTGTPEGVGELRSGQRFQAQLINSFGEITLENTWSIA